ncbi:MULTISPECIES: hypothetical protein, partial [unclassified Pseudomonas]
ISGLRIDQVSAKDYQSILWSAGISHSNPTADRTHNYSLPRGFVRYEYDMANSSTTLYVGLGHA